MLGRKSVEGNQCLFYTFAFFNFFTFLQALALLGVGVYLFIFTEEANTFNVGFIVIALLLIGTSLVAFKLRQRLEWLAAYLGLLACVFLA